MNLPKQKNILDFLPGEDGVKGEDPPSLETISKVFEFSDEFQTLIHRNSECSLCIEFEIHGHNARRAEDGADGGAAGFGGKAGTFSVVAFGHTPSFSVSQEKGLIFFNAILFSNFFLQN